MSVKETQDKRCELVFSLFPPKTDVAMEALCGEGGVVERLYNLHPDAVACTYGIGGGDVGRNLAVLDKIVRDGRSTPLTHFACIGNSKEGIRAQLQTYLDHGIRHVLALRGELPGGRPVGGLQSAAELVELIRREFGDAFAVSVSGNPEGRRSIQEDVEILKRKQDSGANAIVARLCWDMDAFRRWLDGILAAGIWLPVAVEVMPVLDPAEVLGRVMSQNGGAVPQSLSQIIAWNWIYPNPFVKDPFDGEAERKKASFKAAGMEYTLRQIEQYRACGVSGIHLDTRNRFEGVAAIAAAAGLPDIV